MKVGHGSSLVPVVCVFTFLPSLFSATRTVIVKADGVPAAFVDDLVNEKDPTTGKSRLPWIDEVFVHNGTRISNFYVRGISLSAPSWAMLETGQHQIIHGNAEFDRLTLRGYDYLNFFPLYMRHPLAQLEMPGVAVLDEAGTPLIIDRFEPGERFQGLELFQRGRRWRTLEHSLPNRLFSRSPRQLFDEWQSGLELSSSVDEQIERELIAGLAQNRLCYLDYFSGDFDHIAHLTNDRESQVAVLKKLDAFIGRLWTTIRRSPVADQTVLVLVSDHGINSEPKSVSQGYSLLDWFGSAEGGGHHAITNRHPMDQYKIRGLNPLVSQVITAGAGATYLKDEEQQYPTAAFDFDGNERAAVQLRNNTLNILHLLLTQMNQPYVGPQLRKACVNTFFEVLDRHRDHWRQSLAELREDLDALHRAIGRQPKAAARVSDWQQEERVYRDYTQVLSRLLALDRDKFNPAQIQIGDLIPKRSLGERNTVFDLQNYAGGLAPAGPVALASDPSRIDLDRTVRQIDYFAALKRIRVRNNVQPNISADPVDFIAVPLPAEAVLTALAKRSLESSAGVLTQAIWLYAGDRSQALVLARNSGRQLELRYLPVETLKGAPDGSIEFSPAALGPGLPLHIWEDPNLRIPEAASKEWLTGWHSEREWFRAVHATRYSNGIIGITEQFTQSPALAAWFDNAPPEDRRLLLRLEERRRRLVTPDLLVFASDHWNFNVRSFNPGGNHGSFLRISTHSILMFAGANIPRGFTAAEPYDSLSFAPTVLRLLGRDATLPGTPIQELFPVESAADARR
jgi:hypothetical protein